MANITYASGETHILQTYFQGGADFGPFYVGVGTQGAIINEYATLSDVVAREVTGTGYARQQVDRAGVPTGWDVRGDMAQSPVLLFTNNDLTEVWDPIDFVFLTLSPQGTLGDDVIIAACDLADSVLLYPGQTLEVIFRFRQTTVLSNGPRINQGNASASATATGLADGAVI